jgi:hypothetical protein
MKTTLHILALSVAFTAGLLTVSAAEKHDHAHLATPKGGRVLDKTTPHAEVVFEKDRSFTINFYDDALKPVAATSQMATVIASTKSGKTTIEFEKKGDSLASKTKLPEGDGYNVVVQFRQTAEARPQNFRFKLDISICGGCKRAEYGCICGH